MKRAMKLLMSILPLLIVAALLYAGLFIKPEPVGASVVKPIFERGDSFYGIALPSATTIWAAGSNGKIVHSSNNGRSWTLQPTSINATLQDIAAWSVQRAVAVGNGGVVLTTRDAGKTWVDVKVPRSTIANKLVRVKTLPDGVAWAVGEGGVVLRTNDFGVNWSLAAKEEDAAWNDIFFVGRQGWLVGEFGRIRTSRDDGVTWETVDSPVEASLMAVAFKDKLNGVAVGMAGLVMATRDGGEQWTVVTPATAEHLFDVIWDGAKWMAVGGNGVVLTAASSASDWKPVPTKNQTRGWFTDIKNEEGKYYLAGATLTLLEDGTLQNLIH